MVHFTCKCGNALFFENSVCLQCGQQVGYDVRSNRMVPLSEASGLVRCGNGKEHGVCNWVVQDGDNQTLCESCQLNRTIPDLSIPANLGAWQRMESAKRRVLYTLHRLGLRPVSKHDDPSGVAFNILSPTASQNVMTGHLDGVITLNLLEANDSFRESVRATFGEPYRTLVGHIQHELGHYYWDRFFRGRPVEDPLLVTFRELFGDECSDYQTALLAYHTQGPPTTWSETHITSYAASHPWEDWAETWAQYLHILDGIETAEHFGWTSDRVPIPFTPFPKAEVTIPHAENDPAFVETVNRWAKIAPALNEIAASLGHPNLYPFVLSPCSVRKIHFVHFAIGKAKTPAKTAAKPPSPALAA